MLPLVVFPALVAALAPDSSGTPGGKLTPSPGFRQRNVLIAAVQRHDLQSPRDLDGKPPMRPISLALSASTIPF
jgi:hypothetical protein